MNDLITAVQRLLDRIELEGSTPLDWQEYNDLRDLMEELDDDPVYCSVCGEEDGGTTCGMPDCGLRIGSSACHAPLACSGIDKCVFRYNTQFPVVKTPAIGCDVCGLSGSKVSQVMGYVCPRSDCPTKVTC